jgi:neutral ceramidase
MIAAFSQGASGDQNPLYLRPSTNAMASRAGVEITGYEMKREPIEAPVRGMPDAPPADPDVLDNLMRMIESEGQLLGEEVIRVMSTVTDISGNVRIRGIQRTFTCPGRTRVNFDMNDPAYREGVEAEYVDGPDVEHHLGILGLGTTVIAYSDGEIFSHIGQRIKKKSPPTNTMFVELAFGRGVSYIPDDASFGQQTFQVLNARDKPGCAEQTLVRGISEMILDYNNGL